MPGKNGGYTALELIVAVAIMAVALALVGLSVNTVFALNVKESAKEIAAELSKEKVSAMTRTGEVYLRLYKTDEGVFIDTYENDAPAAQGIKVGKASLTVAWYSESNTDGIALDDGGIILAFNKSDGSCMTLGQARALYDASVPPFAGEYIREIRVSGAHKSRSVILWPQTGKIDLEA